MSEQHPPLNSMERPELLAHCLARGREISRLRADLEIAINALPDAGKDIVDPLLSGMIDVARRRSMEAVTHAEKVHSELYEMQARVNILRGNIQKESKNDADA